MTGHIVDTPKGIHRIRQLPDAQLGELWTSIIIDDDVKMRLLSQAALNFTVRKKVPRHVLPLHGVILLVGKPGTGKTSLALGLAHRVAGIFKGQKFRLLEVDPHALQSASLGKTQKAVSELFSQAIAEAAMTGPVIVLLDEVETLATDRSKLSFDANPADVHRATDAVLTQLDHLAGLYPDILFIATSNFPDAIDRAFSSRCDLILEIPLPNPKAVAAILKDCLTGLGGVYPQIGKLAGSSKFEALVAACQGLDGRAIRKTIANAMASDQHVATDPNTLTFDHLLSAAKASRVARVALAA